MQMREDTRSGTLVADAVVAKKRAKTTKLVSRAGPAGLFNSAGPVKSADKDFVLTKLPLALLLSIRGMCVTKQDFKFTLETTNRSFSTANIQENLYSRFKFSS